MRQRREVVDGLASQRVLSGRSVSARVGGRWLEMAGFLGPSRSVRTDVACQSLLTASDRYAPKDSQSGRVTDMCQTDMRGW